MSKDRLNHASPDREPNEQEEFDELQESQEAVDLPDRAAMSVINPGIVGGAGPVPYPPVDAQPGTPEAVGPYPVNPETPLYPSDPTPVTPPGEDPYPV